MPIWQQQLTTYPILTANLWPRGSGQLFRRPYGIGVIVDPLVDAVVDEIVDPVLVVAGPPIWLDPGLPYGGGRRWHMSRSGASAHAASQRPARSPGGQSTHRK